MDPGIPFHRIAPGEKEPLKLRLAPGFRKDSPHPEPQKPNITGRWESVVDDPNSPPKVSWILLINQSSTWIEGRLLEVLDARTKRPRAVQSICGEASPSGTAFAIYPNNAVETGDGTIEIDGTDLRVAWNKGDAGFESQRFVLMPDGKRASFFGPAVDDVLCGKGPIDNKTKALAARAETMPLHSWQVRRLQSLLDPNYMHKLLLWAYKKDLFTTQFERHCNWKTAAQKFEDSIHCAVTTESPGSWHLGDLALIQAFARTILGLNRSVINGNTRSQLQWIENLAAAVRTQVDNATRSPLPQLAADLGIMNGLGNREASGSEDAGEEQYAYELELKIHPPTKDEDPYLQRAAKIVTKAAQKLLDKLPTGMKLGGSRGELTVHRKGRNSPKEDWERTYKVFAGGFGFALGLGEQTDLSGKGRFATREEWTQKDFVGAFKILDGGVWFAPRPSDVAKVVTRDKSKRDWSKTVDDKVEKAIGQLPDGARQVLRAGVRDVAMVIEGAGNHQIQIVPFEDAKKVGTAVGGSFFCSFGWIRLPDDLVTVNDTRPLGACEMQIAARGSARAHFDLGAALLTEEGRKALRKLCAAELPWFLCDDTRLRLTAHCDMVRFRSEDSDLRNMRLAEYRAANVHQAIKDILGDRLNIPDTSIEEKAMGTKEAEEAARTGHEPYRNPHRRRVDVMVNGRHVLTLTEA